MAAGAEVVNFMVRYDCCFGIFRSLFAVFSLSFRPFYTFFSLCFVGVFALILFRFEIYSPQRLRGAQRGEG